MPEYRNPRSASRFRLLDPPRTIREAIASVAKADNKARTQNGHIRDDTRDASRRIHWASLRAICRRKCVASDRVCPRVTLRNLHGKEGVDGSSPSEGSAKAPETGLSRSDQLGA